MDFFKFMEQINLVRFDKFKEELKTMNSFDRRKFIFIYLGTFLGPYLSSDILVLEEDDFKKRCHNVIDNVSLCGQEIDYFHKMVDLDLYPGQYSSQDHFTKWLELYDTIEDLEICQLGPNMKKCMSFAKEYFNISQT